MLLNYSDDGPGPVVVLLHGFTLDRSMWDEQRATVGSTYRVIAPDLRGHGLSAAPQGAYQIDEMADDVIELLDSLHLTEPVVVGGLSMGGYIALSLAARYPTRLRGLMLINTRATSDAPESARVREELANEVETSGSVEAVVATMLPRLFGPKTRASRGDLVEQTRSIMLQTPPLGVIGALRGMSVRPDRTSDLSQLALPTLIIAGSEDALIPLSEPESMATALPSATLVVISDSGHLSPLEKPRETNAAILKFLDALT